MALNVKPVEARRRALVNSQRATEQLKAEFEEEMNAVPGGTPGSERQNATNFVQRKG